MSEYEIDERDLDNAEAFARESERETIVAWLRSYPDVVDWWDSSPRSVAVDLADAIERGDHLKERG